MTNYIGIDFNAIHDNWLREYMPTLEEFNRNKDKKRLKQLKKVIKSCVVEKQQIPTQIIHEYNELIIKKTNESF